MAVGEKIGVYTLTDQEIPAIEVQGRIVANFTVLPDNSLFIGIACLPEQVKWRQLDIGPILYRDGKFYKLNESGN